MTKEAESLPWWQTAQRAVRGLAAPRIWSAAPLRDSQPPGAVIRARRRPSTTQRPTARAMQLTWFESLRSQRRRRGGGRRGGLQMALRPLSQPLRTIMQYATLGHTGLLVSRLCFGTMTFNRGEGYFTVIGTTNQQGADELIKTCLDGGVNFFDTADVYSTGESEEILGQAFKNLNVARKDVVIATKAFGRMGPGRN